MRQLNRRLIIVAAVLSTATLAACGNPTGPAKVCGGVYGGSGTCMEASLNTELGDGGVYGGSGTK